MHVRYNTIRSDVSAVQSKESNSTKPMKPSVLHGTLYQGLRRTEQRTKTKTSTFPVIQRKPHILKRGNHKCSRKRPDGTCEERPAAAAAAEGDCRGDEEDRRASSHDGSNHGGEFVKHEHTLVGERRRDKHSCPRS